MDNNDVKVVELSNKAHYNNRELSWLAFNERVLQEAIDSSNPLGERFKFLAIFSSNLDEFFMVRVAGLKDQVKAEFNKPENKAGMTPKQQLAEISRMNHELVCQQYETYSHDLWSELEEEQIYMVSMKEVNTSQYNFLERTFNDHIFPVLTPMAIDAYRPFPMLLNKSLNLGIKLEDPTEDDIEQKEKFAIVQVPSVLDRFIELPSDGTSRQFIMLEDVIGHFIHHLFEGFEVKSVSQFRITRNADMTIHEEGARDLLKEIEKELKKRKWGAAVRLEIRKDNIEPSLLQFLLNVLEIHEKDVYHIHGPLDLTFLFKFHKVMAVNKEHLLFQTLIPQPPKDLQDQDDIFEVASRKDIFLHHPYESFHAVVDFIDDAADDPDVLAIKQTLYRVSGDSPIIEALKKAAENGKQVTVLVELKARFDEENNVQWAKALEKAGCHVIYGMNYLKTHSKITLVVRKKEGKIERFVHLGTGNYNDVTADFYTDMGIITSRTQFGEDATNFFNYLSGYMEKPAFHHLSVAPFDIRTDFIELINKEIQFHNQYGNGRIILKMNSLTDKSLIMKLYDASRAGVKIDLIVRGICCLRTGIKGISDNITVRSIVGRFLEHSRIYYFYHNGQEKYFLSSADMMTRNMIKRVEILFPIYSDEIKNSIKKILQISLEDNVKARVQTENGVYQYVQRKSGEKQVNSQMLLYDMAYMVGEDEE
ncbi:RNA degradosome polyphosphate kinase [Bacillus solimangrovi]|uniref:Polyphosphate kinase n=1 Tax=Bacillus solimangrovi TaxID=1305675 RepID=A0A1E5LJE5_9BACI|nr:RNA degradosome polyphosphate kinase [Bacillus solimangrovi]OEH94219.1 RNA degradosome polyphosphate kinase [Bacillus solimangrovi]